MPDFTDTIRREVERGNFVFSKHLRTKTGERSIQLVEVEHAIINGEVVEADEKAWPCPKCVFMYPVRPNRPVYVVCGYNGEQAVIITAHWRDPAKWRTWRTREKFNI